jgi:hypothetical protein
MRKLATNLLLLLVAIAVAAFLFPLGLAVTLSVCVARWSGVKTVGYLSRTAFSIALSLDLMANVICRDLFNATLIRNDVQGFGHPYETVSSVLGRHKSWDNLTDAGRALANLLNWLDPEHVEKAWEFHRNLFN